MILLSKNKLLLQKFISINWLKNIFGTICKLLINKI